MGNRYHIPKAKKEAMLTMAAYITQVDIARVLGVSERTVQRVHSLAAQTGDVIAHPVQTSGP